MPRKLPWKTETQGSPPTTTPKKQSPRPEPSTSTPDASTPLPVSRRRPLEHGSTRRPKTLHVQNIERANQEQKGASRIRSPSTSPPPEPPAQQFMTAGPAGDDRYRMVEDELLATAGLFTAHLHRAEYTRLKRLAAAQNAAAIREMERPVVPGPATATATRRRGRAARTAARRGLVARGEGDGPWAGSSLQGLMETPRGEGARLGPASRPREAVVSARLPEVVGGRRDGEASSCAGAGGGGRDQAEAVDDEDEDEDDDDDPFGVRQRRVRREKSREQMVRRTGERETRSPMKPERDTIPRFF